MCFRDLCPLHLPCVLALCLVSVLSTSTSEAGVSVTLYGGKATTVDTRVRLIEPPDTDLEFHDVSWADESFESPIYYGIRFTYWLPKAPNWGISLDFSHAKMLADLSQTVRVEGNRDGSPVSDREALSDTFGALAFSHGHNLLTLNGTYRWLFDGDESELIRRLEPYAGLGLGVAIPHVETEREGVVTDEYQLTGIAAEGLVGLGFHVAGRFALLMEYKLTYANLDGDLNGGASIRVRPWTSQFVVGLNITVLES